MAKKREYTTADKIMLFDYENCKKKVFANPIKYDKQGLVPLIQTARSKNKTNKICLGQKHFYIYDQYVLEALGAYHEDEELGAGFWESYIFLTKEAHQAYLDQKQKHFIEQLLPFVQLGII